MYVYRIMFLNFYRNVIWSLYISILVNYIYPFFVFYNLELSMHILLLIFYCCYYFLQWNEVNIIPSLEIIFAKHYYFEINWYVCLFALNLYIWSVLYLVHYMLYDYAKYMHLLLVATYYLFLHIDSCVTFIKYSYFYFM